MSKGKERTKMDFGTWTTFAVASLIMGAFPGPGVVSIIGFAFSAGRRVALASVAGMALGNTLAMSVSLAGAGAILATSAAAFVILKIFGAIYLVLIGLLAIVRSGHLDATVDATTAISARTAFLTNVAVGTFHPKTILFFVAFATQFISPSASYIAQAVILVATFSAVAALTDTLYALTASGTSQLVRAPKFRVWTQRVGGGFLVAAGVATAAMQR